MWEFFKKYSFYKQSCIWMNVYILIFSDVNPCDVCKAKADEKGLEEYTCPCPDLVSKLKMSRRLLKIMNYYMTQNIIAWLTIDHIWFSVNSIRNVTDVPYTIKDTDNRRQSLCRKVSYLLYSFLWLFLDHYKIGRTKMF